MLAVLCEQSNDVPSLQRSFCATIRGTFLTETIYIHPHVNDYPLCRPQAASKCCEISAISGSTARHGPGGSFHPQGAKCELQLDHPVCSIVFTSVKDLHWPQWHTWMMRSWFDLVDHGKR